MIYNILLIYTFLQWVTWEIEEAGKTFILKLHVTGWALGVSAGSPPIRDRMRPGEARWDWGQGG